MRSEVCYVGYYNYYFGGWIFNRSAKKFIFSSCAVNKDQIIVKIYLLASSPLLLRAVVHTILVVLSSGRQIMKCVEHIKF